MRYLILLSFLIFIGCEDKPVCALVDGKYIYNNKGYSSKEECLKAKQLDDDFTTFMLIILSSY